MLTISSTPSSPKLDYFVNRLYPHGMTPEKLSKTIGDNLRAARDDAGLTQAALSAKSRVAIHHISRLESGKSDLPTVTTLLRLANALSVPLGSLLDPKH